MKTVHMEELPKCDNCKERDAVYDAPMGIGMPWGYQCKECAKGNEDMLEVGYRLEQRTPAPEKNDGKILHAVEPSIDSEEGYEYWESVLFDGEREIVCPGCGTTRTMESDASGVFVCEGCGSKVKTPVPAI